MEDARHGRWFSSCQTMDVCISSQCGALLRSCRLSAESSFVRERSHRSHPWRMTPGGGKPPDGS